MRFLRRSLVGLFLLAATLALFGVAGAMVYDAVQAQMNEEPRSRPQRETVQIVNAVTVQVGQVIPELRVFGEVRATRTLDIRPSAGGRVVEVSPNFRDGGSVQAGEVLLRVDPTDAQSALDRVGADVQDAQAELRDAQRALLLANDELDAAAEQARLRDAALARQVDLQLRGVGTTASVEAAELAVSAANQAILSRRQSIANAEARVDQATTGQTRMQINLAEAKRTLADVNIVAGFDGTLADVTLVEGGRVSANELLARLIDPTDLEVAFRVSTAQYARLLDADGRLILADVQVALDVQGVDLTTKATISRESASVAEGQSGRLIFATLDAPRGFRPGDFATLTVIEPPLDRVALLPSTAVAAGNTVLVIGEGDRLEEIDVQVLRRQGDNVIIRARGLNGSEVVAQRSPILGAGIKVKPLRRSADGAIVQEAPEMVVLTAEKRAELIARIEGNSRIPAAAKQRILDQLKEDEVPAALLARLEG
ncbi:MAG: HlyD family efflux transporter periplasmic adaptor subunit [Yoonia sp.]|nr:HlyD family efflux transporter periplasmic adaptor subunit [Yoonia sp.]